MTGLKLLLLNFIAGIIAIFLLMLLGMSYLDIFKWGTGITGLIFYFLMALAIIFINGWLAQRIWKWH